MVMRRTVPNFGLRQVIREELAKAFAVLRFDANRYASVVSGTDGMTEEQRQRQQKVNAAYQEARSAPASTSAEAASAQSPERSAEEHAKPSQQSESADEAHTQQQPEQKSAPSWAERWRRVKQELMAAFGPKAGVAAIIDHCSKAHAAEVAVDLDIDVKSVQVRSEKNAVGEGTNVVGYIDAPAASQEEVLVFAERLTKACPAARTYGDVEWRRGPPPR